MEAERKAGDWLDKNVEHRGEEVRFHHGTALPDGINKKESHRWQLQASAVSVSTIQDSRGQGVKKICAY